MKKPYSIVLASQSPRRQELLRMANIDFSVELNNDISEDFPDSMPASEVPLYLARRKQAAYYAFWSQPGVIVITADTIVSLNNIVLNKPESRNAAILMLSQLAGQKHTVITGVVLKSKEKEVAFDASTHVFFKPLSLELIEYYVDNYKPFDKAGAYGIQEWIGLIGIDRIEGSYFNVMGLPVDKVYEALHRF
ncbi:Maf family nucleotide pyrophosphatase [Alkaliflexus imshenetskii]|uniref:Maf family nucleotide pyrophosphatase n=1 Tax=Alkaliflexus imshenetskii TaxID=286730 RepID=UPI00047BB9F4|nr:Maf family nucleotide pyrophosphatase [Alkaliflexus imshenetskii]